MTAALLAKQQIARRMRGTCRLVDGRVLAADGDSHADCSTCFSQCGTSESVGIAGSGIEIQLTIDSPQLLWKCPGCGGRVVEETDALNVAKLARDIEKDAYCVRCRRQQS